jgi:hypothetical protein
MKGVGRTVMKGTRIETFQAEVLGVLKNTSPGRDLVLARLSGLGLDRTGVIAGMSGSPVYIDGKLLGAVAYAWQFGKEPIAGITPFCQMRDFVEAFERRAAATTATKPVQVGLGNKVQVGNRTFESATISQDFDTPTQPATEDGLWMVPLRTPVAATGFTARSLKLLRERVGSFGLVPVQGGKTTARVAQEEKDVALEPGGPLAVTLVSGDFDLSGIGTVTHVEGNRVWGWGHPFMSLGGCSLPMCTGYIHTVYPRQTVSFKMGSPLRPVGVLDADVSTAVAGWVGRKPDLLPLRAAVTLDRSEKRTFNVQIARHQGLLAPLVFTALSNAVDMEGDLPNEVTAQLQARIELEGKEPIVIRDTFSGFSGSRAAQALYTPVAQAVSLLTHNPHRELRIKRIDCETTVLPGRTTADIEATELDANVYRPGDTVTATVFVRPYKGAQQRVTVKLALPADLPEGLYTATVMDDVSNARADIRANPVLYNPTSAEQVLEALKVQSQAKRNHLVLRLPTGSRGVAANGKALPDLPPSMVRILANTRRTGAIPVGSAVVGRKATDWVILGADSVSFLVSKVKNRSAE